MLARRRSSAFQGKFIRRVSFNYIAFSCCLFYCKLKDYGGKNNVGKLSKTVGGVALLHQGGWRTVAYCDCMLRLSHFHHFLLFRSGPLPSWPSSLGFELCFQNIYKDCHYFVKWSILSELVGSWGGGSSNF